MSKIIIGIHGLGNKPPEKILKKWWKKALREGFKEIGHPRLFLKFKLVYWSNLLHPEALDPKEKDAKAPLFIEEPYVPAKVFDRKKPGKFKMKLANYVDRQLDRIFLNKDLSMNFSSIADMIIHRYFKDLDTYYSTMCMNCEGTERLAREAIREKLAQVLKKYRKKEILLIAHSMGSIVAYDVLSQSESAVKIDTFVTIGSPLGVPVIIGKIATEQNGNSESENGLKTPDTILKKWYNFSDVEDKVALDHTLGDDYAENSNHVRAIDTYVFNNYEHNGDRNPHKSYGYLRTPEVAQVIHDFLNQGRSKAGIWLTDKISRILH